MALTATCCCLKNLNPPPPLLPSSHSLSPTNTKSHSVSCNNANESSWTKRCVLGVAGLVMALQMGDSVVGQTGAIEMGKVVAVDSRSEKMVKWSEERMCPQWRFNSLETIVPENLPRPFARRRWEAIRLPPTATAPRLQATHSTTSTTRCFSM